MKTYTAIEYILLSLSEYYGTGKLNFEKRIESILELIHGTHSAEQVHETLMTKAPAAKKPALFTAAANALRDALKGEEIGFLVGMDASASGPQIMGVLSGCEKTCYATGLIDKDEPKDLYKLLVSDMNTRLAESINTDRDAVKSATVPFFYGSTEKPKEVFIEGSAAYKEYFTALNNIAPGACEVKSDLMSCWQAYDDTHSWVMPDNFHVVCRVFDREEKKIEVDELNHASFTHSFFEHRGTKTGLSLAANVIHSVDALIAREMVRRCNYKPSEMRYAAQVLKRHAINAGGPIQKDFISLHHVPHITPEYVKKNLTENQCRLLYRLITVTLTKPSFEILVIHDDFKCHPNYMNELRQHYLNILIELGHSDLLSNLISQIVKRPVRYKKFCQNISEKIAGANYHLT